jgi:potassium efflux system protein
MQIMRRLIMPANLLSILFMLGMILLQPAAMGLGAESRNPGSGDRAKSDTLLTPIEKTVAGEKASIEELNAQMGRLKIIEKALLAELNAYKIQHSMHGNLLLIPQTKIEDLERAFSDHKMTLSKLSDYLKDFKQRKGASSALLGQAEDQISLNKKQLSEIKAERLGPSEREALAAGIRGLIGLQTQKLNLLNEINETQGTILNRIEETRTSFSRLSEKLEQQIEIRKKETLFERKPLPIGRETGKILRSEWAQFNETLRQIFRMEFWANEIQVSRKAGGMPLVTFFLLFLIAMGVVNRFRWFWLRQEQALSHQHFTWSILAIQTFQRSLTLLGAGLFLYLFERFQFPHYKVPAIYVMFNVLLVVIFSRWALDFLKYIQQHELIPIPALSIKRIASLVRVLRIFAIVYICIAWIIGRESIFLFLGRLLFEAGLIAWCILFWKTITGTPDPALEGKTELRTPLQTTIAAMSYTVTFGGMVIEIAGYSAFAVYWYVSWTRSAAAVFWTVLIFLALREWQRSQRQIIEPEAEGPKTQPDPFRWLVKQVSWVAWTIFFVIAMIQAWSTQQNVLAQLYEVLSKPFSIGKINLSLMGMAYASLMLFFTHIAAHMGRYILREKILDGSDLEQGLQDSITTITIYVIWGLGVVLSLSVLGVSATSLAVVFGALSIGIGFGLQNIFNNFISGIILLFERPIQVGDAVEVNGIWGEVKKINIRATVVQTFDNASLIIPNSDFISSQVTNWSFKDKSLRRKVDIGVAYGSDVELVRQTLLEISKKTKKILKSPAAEVLFKDHGDSALIFTLRYWTTVDYYYTTETDIRFEIDRLFRERNIEIAFPQRDIHIRSIVKDAYFEAGNKKADPKPSDGD